MCSFVPLFLFLFRAFFKMTWFLELAVFDQVEELCSRVFIGLEGAEESTCDCASTSFLYSSHHHAHMSAKI